MGSKCEQLLVFDEVQDHNQQMKKPRRGRDVNTLASLFSCRLVNTSWQLSGDKTCSDHKHKCRQNLGKITYTEKRFTTQSGTDCKIFSARRFWLQKLE